MLAVALKDQMSAVETVAAVTLGVRSRVAAVVQTRLSRLEWQ